MSRPTAVTLFQEVKAGVSNYISEWSELTLVAYLYIVTQQ